MKPNAFGKQQRRKSKKHDFNPSRPLIDIKIAEYLRRGGKITRIEPGDLLYDPSTPNDPTDNADQFLGV
jgi:hypothetical protein